MSAADTGIRGDPGVSSTSLAHWVRAQVDAGVAPLDVAAAVARRHAISLGLPIGATPSRTIDATGESAPVPALIRRPVSPAPAQVVEDGPWAFGRAHELAIDALSRRRRGVHYTPRSVATGLAAVACSGASTTARICDPAVGGGAFLLAAGDELVARGVPPLAALDQLFGIDVDPGAVEVAGAALACWAAARRAGEMRAHGHGHRWPPMPAGHLVVADTLEVGAAAFERWARRHGLGALRADVVIGNPPFQSQMAGSTARAPAVTARLRQRWGVEFGAYADTAALFLLAGLELLAPGGRCVLIQPRSTLVGAGAEAVRAAVDARARLSGVWLAGTELFDAAVLVCAPVVDDIVRAPEPPRVWTGADVTPVPPTVHTAETSLRWTALASGDLSLPMTAPLTTAVPPLSTVAGATAGFRDQFYGIAPHTVEVAAIVGGSDGDTPSARIDLDAARFPKLVTVGMIDPLRLRWGSGPFRYAGRRVESPVVDLEALERSDAGVARWVRDRLRPKVLVATQTRVVEVVVDRAGVLVPSTPVVAVHAEPDRLWHVAAALTSPVTSATALGRVAGAALTLDTIRLSARQVLELPLPTDAQAWEDGADLARTASEAAAAGDAVGWSAALDHFGAAMIAAAGVGGADAEAILAWWQARRPGWR